MTRPNPAVLKAFVAIWCLFVLLVFAWRLFLLGTPLPFGSGVTAVFVLITCGCGALFLIDVGQNQSLSSAWKAMWILLFVFTGPIGMFLYLGRKETKER